VRNRIPPPARLAMPPTLALAFAFAFAFVLAFISGSRPLEALPDAPASGTREAAARELYRTMGGLKSTAGGADAMLTAVRSNPQLARYEDVFRTWYEKTIAAADLEPKIVALYAEAFSESELKELNAFYQTPLGRKALSRMPDVIRKAAELEVEAARANQPELERMLEERRKKIEAETPAPSGTPAPTPASTPAPGASASPSSSSPPPDAPIAATPKPSSKPTPRKPS